VMSTRPGCSDRLGRCSATGRRRRIRSQPPAQAAYSYSRRRKHQLCTRRTTSPPV